MPTAGVVHPTLSIWQGPHCSRGTPQVLLALACYATVSFLFNLLDEVRPIFASAPIENGGLDMTAEALAWSLSFGGVSFILYVLLGGWRCERLHHSSHMVAGMSAW